MLWPHGMVPCLDPLAVDMRLRLADAPYIESPDGTVRPLALRDAAMLAWLALEGPTPRDRIAALLWPASTEAQARTTLRQRLFQMKKTLGVEVAVGSPLLQLQSALSHDLLDAIDLLGGQGLPDAPEMDAWLQRQRQQRQGQETAALQAQALAQEAAGDLAGALAVAQALLRQDPLTELAHQRVMRLHYLMGDRAAALQAFDACEQVLKNEVGTRPSPQTLDLLATIEQAAPLAPRTALRTMPLALQRPPRLVGREAPWHALLQARACGQVVAVLGEAGMGKSRLLQALVQAEADLLQVAARPGDAAVPYATLARLLRAVLQRSAVGDLSTEARQQLSRLMPELGEAHASVAAGQRLALQRVVVATLQDAGCDRSVLLDDLHFADPASLEMLPTLLCAPGPWRPAWVLAWRPADAGAELRALQAMLVDAARLSTVRLAPLDEQAVADLVDQLGWNPSGRSMAPRLLQHTGGNPLFLLETLKALWNECGFAPLDDRTRLPIGGSARALIDQRIEQLSPAAKALARVASIAGVDFGIGLAESVLGQGALQLSDAWRELESAQVLHGTQFAHDLVQEAVLASVPAAIARHVHAKLAAWLEQHPAEPARTARHWIDAQQPLRALPWIRQAEQRARQALRNAEQLAWLDQRSAIEEAAGQWHQAFETQLLALDAHRNTERSEAGFLRCDALDRLAQTPLQRIQAWMARAEYLCARKEGDMGLALSQQALAEAQRIGDGEWTHRAQLWLASTLHTLGRLPEAQALLEAGLPWALGHADPSLRLDFHSSLAHLYAAVGQLDKARAQYDLSGALARQCGDALSEAIVQSSMATVLSSQGRVAEALDQAEQSIRRREQFETSTASSAVSYNNRSLDAARIGRFSDALRWGDEAERRFALVSPKSLPLLWAGQAQCWLQLGQTARATQVLRRVTDSPDLLPIARAKTLQLRFELGRVQGEPDLAALSQALQVISRESSPYFHLVLTIQHAQTLAPREAIEALDRACEDALGREFMGQVLDTHLQRARLVLPLDPDLAHRHVQQALDLAGTVVSACGYRAELWLHAATVLLATGDRARAFELLREGVRWVHNTARDQVPLEFADSFLHRNPVNVQLLALASRNRVATSA